MKKKLFKKAKYNLMHLGFSNTAMKIIRYVKNYFRYRGFKRVLSLEKLEDRFTQIYKLNHWGSAESRSGTGSTFEYTRNLRKHLPFLINRYSINTIFDAPCGDFNWMRHILPSLDVDYIGGDIVGCIVDELNVSFCSERVKFIRFDLTRDIPPRVDLMICRDCLIHFSYEDASSVLARFLDSKSSYLLTTTHANLGGAFKNYDIQTGDFKYIDLFSSPYCFPRDTIDAIEDWLPPDPQRFMCLWTRDQVFTAYMSLSNHLKGLPAKLIT